MRRWHLGAALLTIAAIPAIAAGCDTPPLGQIMLVVKTDMAPPKDFDTLRIEVFNEGALKFEYEGPIPGDPDDEARVVLPSTLGLVAPEDPTNSIRIEVGVRSGGLEGKVRVVREIVTTIPADRVAMLNVPIQFLCKKDNIPLDNQNNLKPSDCPDGKTCIAGTCEDSVVDSATLPDYDEDEVFGGSGTPEGGKCFDVQSCFSAAQIIDLSTLDLPTCSFPVPSGASGLDRNFALSVESDGICNSVGCFVALDAESDTGWRLLDEGGPRIHLPAGVCENLQGNTPSSLKVLQIVQAPVSDDCPLKEVKYPTCGPWSAIDSGSADEKSAVAIAGAQDHPIAVTVIPDQECLAACPQNDAACAQSCEIAYWTNAGNPDADPPTLPSIKGVSVNGGASGSVELEEPPRDILAGPEGLYFTSAAADGQGSIYTFRFNPPQGQPALVPLLGGLTQPDGIARSGNKLFWTEFLDPGRVYEGTLAEDGASFTGAAQEISLNNPYPVRIVADSQFVYWTNESTFDDKLGAVGRIDHTVQTATTEILTSEALAVPRALAIDLGENDLAAALYFATLADGKVWRIPNASAATPGAAEVFADGLSAPNGIAVDAKNVYIANRGNGTILYKPKDAAASDPPKVIASGQKNPGHILVSGTNLIWVNEGPSKTDAQEGSIVKYDVSDL